jgi:hypothetical protein
MYPIHPYPTSIWVNDSRVDLHVDLYINGKMVYLVLPYDEFEIVCNVQATLWKDRPQVIPDEYGAF